MQRDPFGDDDGLVKSCHIAICAKRDLNHSSTVYYLTTEKKIIATYSTVTGAAHRCPTVSRGLFLFKPQIYLIVAAANETYGCQASRQSTIGTVGRLQGKTLSPADDDVSWQHKYEGTDLLESYICQGAANCGCRYQSGRWKRDQKMLCHENQL